MSEDNSNRVLKPIRCYVCSVPYEEYVMRDVRVMLIDGVKHDVPVYGVPCRRCPKCEMVVTDGSADEVLVYCLERYKDAHGLNTLDRRIYRWLRRRWLRLKTRWEMACVKFCRAS